MKDYQGAIGLRRHEDLDMVFSDVQNIISENLLGQPNQWSIENVALRQ